MYQKQQLVDIHAKAIATTSQLSQLALENTQEIADIHFEAVKHAMDITQAKLNHVVGIQDPQQVLTVITPEEAQATLFEGMAVQGKVAKVFGKSRKEMISMLESVIDDTQAELRQAAKEITGMAPVGTAPLVTAFDHVFDAALQGFDQVYAVSKDAYIAYEKSIENAIESFQGQDVSFKKTAAKKTKAIAA